MTILEFLYGSEFKNLILHRPVTKNSRIFPGIENKTVMKSIGYLWNKSDSHLTQTLQVFVIHFSKLKTALTLNVYCM